MSKIYNLFISHSWAYSENYEALVNLLNQDNTFSYRNYSVPRNDPIHTNGTDRDLYNAIKRQMQPASVVIILAGVYATYSKWINKEIKIAQNEFIVPKKIIAVEYWGTDKTSRVVKNAADAIVKWNTASLINKIKELTY